jgi:hypothetical protein
MIKYSEKESQRFNKKVFRGEFPYIDVNEITEHINANNPELLILRFPVSSFYKISELEKLKLHFIVADVLVYYSCILDKNSIKPIKNNGLNISIANKKDELELTRLIKETFSGYTNHYFSNPLLDKSLILDGYTEWALSHIDNKDKFCFIVKDDDETIAFAACSIHDSVGEGVLFGVSNKYSGRGIYTDLIRTSSSYFLNNSLKKMIVSTQIQNLTVQKVWSKEGFLIDSGYITIHVNNTTK